MGEFFQDNSRWWSTKLVCQTVKCKTFTLIIWMHW